MGMKTSMYRFEIRIFFFSIVYGAKITYQKDLYQNFRGTEYSKSDSFDVVNSQ